jgi:hypothetical protein
MLLDFAAAIWRAALMMSGSSVSVVRIESRSFRHILQAHHSITPSTHQMSEGMASATFERHCAFCALLTDLSKNVMRLETNG